MKIFQKVCLTVAVAACMALNASALTLTPASMPQITGDDNSNLSDAELSTLAGETLTSVYKRDVGSPDSGTFAASYKTTFSNSATDPEDALIEYQSGPSISGSSIWLYVKDGNQEPAFYLFNISGWNGTDDIVLDGFWPNQGAISHITILTGGGTSVPDGGTTVALLGAAVGLLGFVRRKISA